MPFLCVCVCNHQIVQIAYANESNIGRCNALRPEYCFILFCQRSTLCQPLNIGCVDIKFTDDGIWRGASPPPKTHKHSFLFCRYYYATKAMTTQCAHIYQPSLIFGTIVISLFHGFVQLQTVRKIPRKFTTIMKNIHTTQFPRIILIRFYSVHIYVARTLVDASLR